MAGRFSRLGEVEGTFGPIGFVAGAFNRESSAAPPRTKINTVWGR